MGGYRPVRFRLGLWEWIRGRRFLIDFEYEKSQVKEAREAELRSAGVSPEVLSLLPTYERADGSLWRAAFASTQATARKKDAGWSRTIYHPEHKRTLTLDQLLAQYAWHCNHDLRHITALVERQG